MHQNQAGEAVRQGATAKEQWSVQEKSKQKCTECQS